MITSEYKYLTLFQVVFAWVLFTLIGCNNKIESNIQTEIDRIASRFVPDQRIAICRITAKNGKGRTFILRGETTNPDAKTELIKALSNKGINLIDSILILPDTVNNSKFSGLVSVSVLNLRKYPDHKSELVSQSILGTPVIIMKEENSWLLIQTPDKYIAWTEKSSIKLMSRTEMAEWKHSERVIYLENTGWIYSSPDESMVVSDIVAGCIMQKEGESGGYAKVLFPDGRTGYIPKKKTEDFTKWKNRISCNEENICKRAVSYMGLPYLWGGSSTKGVDCSGFVQSVYFMNGIILSRDASLQALHGLPVDISKGIGQLRKGDLLFFGTTRNAISHVSHTAIYLGDGDYINSSGRVMVNSFDSTRNDYNGYRKNSFLAAKRVMGVVNDAGIVPIAKHSSY